MTEEVHPPLEEYLETIYCIWEEGTPVIQARIAQRLGRSAPSVSEMLERLAEASYITRKGRIVNFTSEGLARAEGVVRKHRLAERLLVDVIGLEWHKAHAEAGRWEHAISDEVEGKLVELLGNPGTCPHGNPIPVARQAVRDAGSRGSERNRRSSGTADATTAATAVPANRRDTLQSFSGHMPLSDIEPAAGRSYVIRRVTEEIEADSENLAFLSNHGLIPGTAVAVLARSGDGHVTLERGSEAVIVSPWMARRVYLSTPLGETPTPSPAVHRRASTGTSSRRLRPPKTATT